MICAFLAKMGCYADHTTHMLYELVLFSISMDGNQV